MTRYRIAENAADYRRAHEVVVGEAKMTFPTILAESNDEVVGVASTHRTDKAVILGKFVADVPWIALNLIQAYENVLILAGIVEYLIPIRHEDQSIQRLIERTFEIEPYTSDEEHVWYKRQLNVKVTKH